jgi:agmatine deiminase
MPPKKTSSHRPAGTAAALGFRMPAEWEPQEAIWLSWPVRRRTWRRHFSPIPAKFAEITAAISRFEEVRINLARSGQPGARALLRRAGANLDRVKFYVHPTNDAWCRDHGPNFVRNDRTGEVAVNDWDYNAWGEKYRPFDRDNAIPGRIAAALKLRRFRPGMVLEGGSIDVNGADAVLTTEAVLLNPNRNPWLTRAEIEQRLRDFLGVKLVHWLGDGIVGDDTDGHVDDLARFFSTDGIVTAVESNRKDINYPMLSDNLDRLKSLRNAAGRRYRIVELPMPKPVYREARRLPATYANFLVLNGAVLMPTFRQPRSDARAAAILASCFPGREIVPIDCVDLVWGRGTLHCISQQQPAALKLLRRAR